MRTRRLRLASGTLMAMLILSATGISQGALTRNTRFGKSGFASKDFSGADDTTAAVLVDTGNDVIVVGNSAMGFTSHIALARFTEKTGQVDTIFTAGTHPTTFSTEERAEAAAWQDNNIVVVGSALVGGGCWQMVVGRFTSTGALDTSFGTAGWVHLDVGMEKFGASGNTYGYGLAIDPNDQRIVAVGKMEQASGQCDVAVVFLNANGSRVDAAGKTDIVVKDFSERDDRARGVVINNGQAFVAGTANTGAIPSNDFAVLCLDESTRQPSASFGADGVATFDIGALATGGNSSSLDICNDIVFDGSNLRLVGRTDAFDARSGDDVAVLTVSLTGAAVGQPTAYNNAGEDDALRAVYDSSAGLIIVGRSQTGLLIINNGSVVIDDVQPTDVERGVGVAMQADKSKLVVALDAGVQSSWARDMGAVRYYTGVVPADTATITVVESATCANVYDFQFSRHKASPSSDTSFKLGLSQISTSFTLSEDDYDITQTIPSGWLLQSVQVTGGDNDALTQGARIHLCRGDNVTITFTNKDTTTPSVTTKNISVALGPTGAATIQPQDVFADGSDVCGVTLTSVTPNTFGCGNIGANTVTLRVADGAGNTNSATATVTVVDSTPPTLVGKNVTWNLDVTGQATVTPAAVFDAAGSTDNCGQVYAVSVTPSSFTCANLGDNLVTLTANDGHGNTSTCTATLTVQDLLPPVVVCKNIEVALDATGHASIAPGDVIDNMWDNCAVASTSLSKSSFDCSNIGPNSITVTATDSFGTPGTNSATVTVKDTQAPQLTACPANISVHCDPGSPMAIVNWTAPTASDNCTASVTFDHSPGEAFPVGTTSVTYTASDSETAPATCSFSVTVSDSESPTWTGCPQNITQPADPGGCTAVVNWVEPTPHDNVGVSGSSKTHTPGMTFSLGATTVTYSAFDLQGNFAVCTFNVTVTDTQGPTITACPADRTIDSGGGCRAPLADLTGEVLAADDCSNPLTITQNPAAGTELNLGTTPVLITVRDTAGNSTTCTAQVTVADRTKPQIVSPPLGRRLLANDSCQADVPDLTAEMVASDDCDAAPVKSQQPAAGTHVGLGDTTVTLTVEDQAGNAQTCTATITVEDRVPPAILATPPDRQLAFNNVCAAATPDLTGEMQVLDKCDPAPRIVQAPVAGTPLGAGRNVITLTVTDASGNSNSATVEITVGDNTPPQLSCPAPPAPISADGNCQAATPDLVAAAVADDNCPGLTITQSPTAGRLLGPGDHTVTLTATDAAHLSSTCDVVISVVDTTPPGLACPAAPAPIVADDQGQAAVPNLAASAVATDACPNVGISQSPAAGTMVGLGDHTVVLTASDAAGMTATCNIVVKVIDASPPGLTCPAAPDPIAANEQSQAAIPDLVTGATVVDASPVNVTQNPASGTVVGLGDHTVVLTATDAVGLTSTCNVVVRVFDQTPPKITCPAAPDPIVADDQGKAAIPDLVAVATVVDASHVNMTQNPAAGTVVGLGDHTVVLTATDAVGLTSTCSVAIKVVDKTPPVIVCPADVTVTANSTLDVSTLIAPEVSDNAGAQPTVTTARGDDQAGDCPVLLIETVIWTATDQAGNTTTCKQRVFVTDVDSDQDGTADCADGCASDPNKTEPGTCGCGNVETADCGGAGHTTPNDSGQTSPDQGNPTTAPDDGNQTTPDDGTNGQDWRIAVSDWMTDVMRNTCGATGAVSMGMLSFGMLGLKSMYTVRRRKFARPFEHRRQDGDV